MKKRSDTLPLWLKVVLAVLPGIFAAGVEICERQISNVAYPYLLAPLFFCSLFLCIAGFIYERQLAIWSFPALGLLLAWMPIDSPLMLAVWLGIVAVLVARWLWSFKYWEVSLLGLLLIGSAVLLVVVGFEEPEGPTPYLPDWLALPIFTLSSLSILPGIVGLFLARRTGVLATLVFAGSAFVMWETIGDSEYALLLWTDSKAVELAVALHPSFFFLILVPLAGLLTRSAKARFASFLLPITVGLVSAAAIASTVRPYASFVHRMAVDIIVILAPLTIFMILYVKRGNPGKNQTLSPVSAYR
ncbi:MAG: hypothetical protein JW918_10415 [Anaerolineae bacterium]|nr:hypothetical protein [Anaerolineae bacterium]